MGLRTVGAPVLCAFLAATTATAEMPTAMPTPARIAYPGGLDRSFGVRGFAAARDDTIVWESVALQPDGKIVVAGNRGFGGGIVVPAAPADGRATAVTVTDREELVVVGSAYRPTLDGVDAFALRLDADGAVDPSFANGRGVAIVPLDGNGNAQAVLAQTSGRVVVLADVNRPGNTPTGAAVLFRLRANGTLDPAFGTGGVVRVQGDPGEFFEASTAVGNSDGSLLVAATSYSNEPRSERGHTIRFDRDGHLLRTFDVFSGLATGVAAVDGKVVVNGSSTDETRSAFPAFLRFDADGSLDEGFGDRGVLAMIESAPGTIAVDDHDRIVVVADVLARHFADGVLDTSFGLDGIAAESVSAAFHAVTFQPDGKIVAAGGACFSNQKGGDSGCFASLARYESDRTQLCGDADASGALTVTDAVATLRAAAGLEGPCNTGVCDVDGDGAVGVTDGVNVLRAAAGLPATLSCGIP